MVDIRKTSEYEGSIKDNYKFFESAGHIPKAIHMGNWDDLCDKETGLLRDLDEIKKLWESLGITGKGGMNFYCGTGWRSSIGFFITYLLGWNGKNYDDSFYGWSSAGNEIVVKSD